MVPPTFVIQTSGVHDVVLPPQLIQRDIRCSVGLITMAWQQLQSQMPSQVYVNYAMGSLQEGFLFQELRFLPIHMSYVGVCYGVSFLLSHSHMAVW